MELFSHQNAWRVLESHVSVLLLLFIPVSYHRYLSRNDTIPCYRDWELTPFVPHLRVVSSLSVYVTYQSRIQFLLHDNSNEIESANGGDFLHFLHCIFRKQKYHNVGELQNSVQVGSMLADLKWQSVQCTKLNSSESALSHIQSYPPYVRTKVSQLIIAFVYRYSHLLCLLLQWCTLWVTNVSISRLATSL